MESPLHGEIRTMLLSVERSTFTPPALPSITNSPEFDGSITGRFIDVPNAILATLLEHIEAGTLQTYAPGRRYRMTELLAEGNCQLMPDFSV
jgi:hypothetical protein